MYYTGLFLHNPAAQVTAAHLLPPFLKTAGQAKDSTEESLDLSTLNPKVQLMIESKQAYQFGNLGHLAEFSHLLSVVLCWDTLVHQIDVESPKRKADIVAYIRSSAMPNLHALLDYLFELMLETHHHHTSTSLAEPIHASTTFRQQEVTEHTEQARHYLMAGVASAFCFHILAKLPALMRGWWSDLTNKGLKTNAEQYISSEISPELVAAELVPIRDYKGKKFDDFGLKLVQNDVVASYKKDDMELSSEYFLSDRD